LFFARAKPFLINSASEPGVTSSGIEYITFIEILILKNQATE
jgi:hypothetical protein